jgi:hypothetical protein
MAQWLGTETKISSTWNSILKFNNGQSNNLGVKHGRRRVQGIPTGNKAIVRHTPQTSYVTVLSLTVILPEAGIPCMFAKMSTLKKLATLAKYGKLVDIQVLPQNIEA